MKRNPFSYWVLERVAIVYLSRSDFPVRREKDCTNTVVIVPRSHIAWTCQQLCGGFADFDTPRLCASSAAIAVGVVYLTGCSAGLLVMVSLFIYFFYSMLGGHVAEGLLGMYTSGTGILVATMFCVDSLSGHSIQRESILWMSQGMRQNCQKCSI